LEFPVDRPDGTDWAPGAALKVRDVWIGLDALVEVEVTDDVGTLLVWAHLGPLAQALMGHPLDEDDWREVRTVYQLLTFSRYVRHEEV
jgi:hypothetical protein